MDGEERPRLGFIGRQPSPSRHLPVALQIAKLLEEHKLGKGPGRTGIFGNLIFSHELVHQIGGENDSNSNTTRLRRLNQ